MCIFEASIGYSLVSQMWIVIIAFLCFSSFLVLRHLRGVQFIVVYVHSKWLSWTACILCINCCSSITGFQLLILFTTALFHLSTNIFDRHNDWRRKFNQIQSKTHGDFRQQLHSDRCILINDDMRLTIIEQLLQLKLGLDKYIFCLGQLIGEFSSIWIGSW